MALRTLYRSMLSIELKREKIVIKIIPKAIHSIMTLETVLAERYLMFHHERHIHLDVTLATRERIELRDVLPVTVGTQERFFRSREQVPV